MRRSDGSTTASGAGRPQLSIICTGRNDERAPDQFERLICVQRTLAHALRNVAYEFLFIEWNPDPDRNYLGEALFLPNARHYVVTRDAHKRLIADAQMSTRDGKAVKGERAFLLNHANNLGLKHARGEWVLITNLDDLFPAEFGELFERGQSGALAEGIHPRWSYQLLIRYRRAQRSASWRKCKRAFASMGSTLRRARRAAGVLRIARRWAHGVRSRLASLKYALVVSTLEARYRLRLGLSAARRSLRALVIRLLGGADSRPRQQRGAWRQLPIVRAIFAAVSSRPIRPLFDAARLAAGALVIIATGIRKPRATARRVRQSLRRYLEPVRFKLRRFRSRAESILRKRTRALAKAIYDFFFSPRVNWHVGRVPLRPGTLYRVRRQHVSDAFACRGASADSIEQYIAEVKDESVPGPWNNHFPWTFACGDFLLMDRATWERIGGFPQQIGQLHADSVTIFRIVAEGCPVVLLDWNIYHMDHDDRFDAVPYVEYDFENVHRYFGPGWTRAEATLLERSDQRTSGYQSGSHDARPVLVAASRLSRMREELQ